MALSEERKPPNQNYVFPAKDYRAEYRDGGQGSSYNKSSDYM